jgi:hypothetical protein
VVFVYTNGKIVNDYYTNGIWGGPGLNGGTSQ